MGVWAGTDDKIDGGVSKDNFRMNPRHTRTPNLIAIEGTGTISDGVMRISGSD